MLQLEAMIDQANKKIEKVFNSSKIKTTKNNTH